ncbi:hypothetical protein [Deinococcus multiflagellatus]|uniref:Uncharacterized protein n=1 Tax=Deinococcus multiflagellatus TaxID=1656887 RepID=A0ABW1ZS80_9DEIO|nr:hypothetical protein [Deinococcus multiflagellatus]MBZ9714896.1 hypothetical protein [Deinococcus multiflagellatus]
MRRTFLHADRDTFSQDQKEQAILLSKGEDGTALSDVMSKTRLGRTAAMSLLKQLEDGGILYSTYDRTRRHLRYRFDGFDIDTSEVSKELEALLISTLSTGPATAPQLATALRLPYGQVKSTLEWLRSSGILFGPRTQNARIYYSAAQETNTVVASTG